MGRRDGNCVHCGRCIDLGPCPAGGRCEPAHTQAQPDPQGAPLQQCPRCKMYVPLTPPHQCPLNPAPSEFDVAVMRERDRLAARVAELEQEWKATWEHRFYEMEHGRADRLAAPDPTAGEAEHAALLRVAEAAERVREYPRTHTTNVHERDLDKALAELRRARGKK